MGGLDLTQARPRVDLGGGAGILDHGAGSRKAAAAEAGADGGREDGRGRIELEL